MNKSTNIRGSLVCRLCLQEIEYDNFKEHSKICKKCMEKKYLMNILKKNGISYFSNLNSIERKINQNILIERYKLSFSLFLYIFLKKDSNF